MDSDEPFQGLHEHSIAFVDDNASKWNVIREPSIHSIVGWGDHEPESVDSFELRLDSHDGDHVLGCHLVGNHDLEFLCG